MRYFRLILTKFGPSEVWFDSNRLFFFFALAHYQNGEISNEFAQNLDVCLANDTQTENASAVLLTVSKDNVYDGYINKGFPIDLKRTFIAIRKANSNRVQHILLDDTDILKTKLLILIFISGTVKTD